MVVCHYLADLNTEISRCHHQATITPPNDRLQFRGQTPVTPLSAQDKGSIVVQHRVGAAPDDDRPVVVLGDPHPLPVLYLRDDGGLGLGVVVPQDPGTGPVDLRDRHQEVSLTQ